MSSRLINSSVSRPASFKIKFFLFVVYLAAIILLHRYLKANDLLTPETFINFLNSEENFNPVLFILIYGVGICLFCPAILLSAVGAMLYGTLFGFYFNMAGSMLGASLAFFISRYFGNNLFSSIIAKRLSSYQNKLAKNGFVTTLYLRLVCVPFTPLSFGMGLMPVTFRQYFWGTFFGKFASGFMITFFFATMKDVLVSGQIDQLVTLKSLFAWGLFVGSFFIPKLLHLCKLDSYFELKEKSCSAASK